MSLFVPFVSAACIYSLGGSFRRPALRNPWLALAASALFALVSLLVLLPPCDLTKAFHMASEPFNTPCPAVCYPADTPVDFFSFDYTRRGCGDCPTNPVWLAYQQPQPLGPGGAPSPGMGLAFRWRMLALAFSSSLVMLVVESLMMRKRRSRPRPGKLRLSV